MELRSVVCLNILNIAVNQVKQSVEKVGGISGAGAFVHSSKSYLGKEVYAGKDMTLKLVPANLNGIQAQQKAASGFFLKLGNSFLFLGF